MPYGYRRSSQRRKPYRKRFNKNQSLAKKAYSLAKKAYKAPELKYKALSNAPASVLGTGSVTQLDTIQQGLTNNNRIGDRVLAKSLHYRMELKLHASATDTLVRCIVFRWISEQPASAGDVLESVTIGSFKDEDQRYSSQILMDRVYRLSTAEKPELFVSGKIKINKHITYPEGSSTSNRNALYVLFVSDEAVNTPSITFNTRLFYIDP